MCQVFIGSIFYEVDEKQLRDAFNPFGTIKVVNLNLDPMTGKHKGFAFIWYDVPEAAQLAIEHMNSQNMWGRPIKVGRPTQAHQYLKIIEQTVIESKKQPRVFVNGVHPDIDEDLLKGLFSPFGDLVRAEISRDEITKMSKGYAFLEYKTLKSTNDAVASMNGFEVMEKSLRVGKAIAPPWALADLNLFEKPAPTPKPDPKSIPPPLNGIGFVMPKLAPPL